MCPEHSLGIEILTAATLTGTALSVPTTEENDFRMATVMNSSDQTIKLSYATSQGATGYFLVAPGYTHTRESLSPFVNSSLKVTSMGSAGANGSIVVNLGN